MVKEGEGEGKAVHRAGERDGDGAPHLDGSIVPRDEDAYEEEIADDPERVRFRVSAKKSIIFLELFLRVAVGAAAGYGLWYLLRHHAFRYSYFKWSMLLNVTLALPPALMFLLSLRRIYPLLAKRYEVSRRFIRSELFAGINLVETADMTKVVDCQMTKLGPVVNIVVHTRDKTTPIIRMQYIPRGDGEKLFAFMTAHANGSWMELRAARRSGSLHRGPDDCL